jgi:hypothetical protein
MGTIRVRRILSVVAGATALAFAFVAFAPRGTYIAIGQPAPDVMQEKLQQAFQTLTNPGHQEEQYQQAIDEAMEAIYTSNLIVLPTANQPEAGQSFQEHSQMAQDAIDALTQHVQGAGTGQTKSDAAEARNFIQLTEEAMQAVGQQTQGCSPTNPTGAGCQLLLQGEESAVDSAVSGFQRQVRSPFFLNVPSREPEEAVILPGTLRKGECAPVVKETRGIQAVVRPTVVPIWVNPWFARATVVGSATVWVLEFVPAEFVKTITYCNVTGAALKQSFSTKIVRDRPEMSLWRYLRNG